jgi:5-methylcytosine-specific restriction protein A
MPYPDLMTIEKYRFTRYMSARLQDKVEGILRGPNGRRLCRWCRTEVSTGMRTFCGEYDCYQQFNLRCGRMSLVILRDKGMCALCGINTKTIRTNRWNDSPYDIDHIVPVSEGGGCCGLSNLRTLCKPCHKGETKKLAKKRAKVRRELNGKAIPKKLVEIK